MLSTMPPGISAVRVHLKEMQFGALLQILMRIRAEFVVQEAGEEDRRFRYIKITKPITEKQWGKETDFLKENVLVASKVDFVQFILNPHAAEDAAEQAVWEAEIRAKEERVKKNVL